PRARPSRPHPARHGPELAVPVLRLSPGVATTARSRRPEPPRTFLGERHPLFLWPRLFARHTARSPSGSRFRRRLWYPACSHRRPPVPPPPAPPRRPPPAPPPGGGRRHPALPRPAHGPRRGRGRGDPHPPPPHARHYPRPGRPGPGRQRGPLARRGRDDPGPA